MNASATQQRDEAMRAIENHTGADAGGLAAQLLEHVATEDLLDRSPQVLAGLVSTMRNLAQQREPEQTLVRVFNPDSSADGFTAPNTIVQICTDDMPFLVDSVTAAISGAGHLVDLLIHPQILLTRSDDGALQKVHHGRPTSPEASVESWMTFAVDRMSDTGRADLTDRLRKVLADVRDAVSDWSGMRQQCEALARELEAGAPQTVPSAEVEPAERFLRWLSQDNFTFLGYREYALDTVEGADVLRPVTGTGLGILRHAPEGENTYARLRPEASETSRQPHLLTITKANSRATVHRPVYLDYIGIRTFNEQGNVTGERRFLGMFTTAAYAESVLRLPIISDKARAVLARSGFSAHSHSGKDLLAILEDYPRDELFQADVDTLVSVTEDVQHLAERRRSKLFLRSDQFGRFVSALVYLPRDRYNTAVRLRIEAMLREAIGAEQVDHTTRVSESALAHLHFVLRMPKDTSIPQLDMDDLQTRLAEATRTWEENLLEALHEHPDEEAGMRFARGFPEAYKEDFDSQAALTDLAHLNAVESGHTPVHLYAPAEGDNAQRRIKIYRRDPLILTDVLPQFTHLGVAVLDERPYRVTADTGARWHIYDFGLRLRDNQDWPEDDAAATRFEEALLAVRAGRAESDALGELVLLAGVDWREVVVLRTIARYLRQIGSTFSVEYLEAALVANPHTAAQIVRLFEARFDPERPSGSDGSGRDGAQEEIRAGIMAALDDVASLDQDRIIRAFVGVVDATVRTNYFQTGSDGAPHPHVSLKLDCAQVPDLPAPVPMAEIWVYSPRVEGVHLRFGAVARGGLRWSDRREDFRTEVLGLVKAQMVKNAVIVPTGSKGGFYGKQLPDPSLDRQAWMEEGRAAYVQFIRGMLDVTDNRVGEQVRPPKQVVRHDGDDTYLVVAADKGTASFSDLANSISAEYNYWLDDAFASGGSTGYDHKEMGITARGAWESTKRHFLQMGSNSQTEDFTVVGIGDMSGDVFGNGMLLSEHICLVAAFDHRHVFIDPTPDAATSYAERRRLFDLPRSTWADYDTSLISEGGGVFARTAKSVTITRQMRTALGLSDEVSELSPADLINACLQAPVDLLYNGGIGTYIKASSETDAEIGDRANDSIRVDGAQLRCKVVVEGGNLGASQLGRIEAAERGIRINTDAIDNSAGVGSSDHEVNLKILFTSLIKEGALSFDERNELLASMTEEVAALVLRDNYVQNVLLGNSRAQAHAMIGVHQRLIHWLEERGELDRELEFLPSDAEIARRDAAGQGLLQPEFAVLVAYAKLALKADLATTDMADGEWFHTTLRNYFPAVLRDRFAEQIEAHPLRKEIIVNAVVNSMVNRGGITFAYRASDETGAGSEQVARAFVTSREIFDLASYTDAVEELDAKVPSEVQTELYLDFRRLLDRSSRWFVQHRPDGVNVAREIEAFANPVREMARQLPEYLDGDEQRRCAEQAEELIGAGVPEELAERASTLIPALGLLDVVELADQTGERLNSMAALYYATSERFGIDTLLIRVAALPLDDRWEALARAAVRDDLYGTLADLTRTVAQETDAGRPSAERLEAWEHSAGAALERARNSLPATADLDSIEGLAPVSVAVRALRSLVRS